MTFSFLRALFLVSYIQPDTNLGGFTGLHIGLENLRRIIMFLVT